MWKKQGSVVLRLEQSRVPGCLYLPQLLSHLIVPFLPCSKCCDLMIYMQVDYVCSHAAIDTVGQHQSSKATVHTLHYRRRWIAGLIQILRYWYSSSLAGACCGWLCHGVRKCLTVSKGPTPLICDDLWLSYVIMTIHSISVRSECWRETFAVQPVLAQLVGLFLKTWWLMTWSFYECL